MFRAALVKMTLLYLAITMTISFFFSLTIYQVSTQELNNNLGRQQNAIERFGRIGGLMNNPDFLAERELLANQARENILRNLLYTNAVILILGGGVSYFLAGRTLKPIEESHESQSRFTGDASHELRSPLAAMKSEIEVALRDPKLTKEEAIVLLKSNLEEVERLKSLSDGLLELARDNGQTLEKADFELTKTLDESIMKLGKKIKAKHISIEKDVDETINVHAIETQIHELVVIVLDNAIKYSNENQKITIETSTKGKSAVIRIKDEGIGINTTDLKKIFDRFYRVEKSRSHDHTPGYGLGLALAKKIVAANNGMITAESRLGSGSTFTVKLPLAHL
jgi:two-component system sensor histidine kinase CiaH